MSLKSKIVKSTTVGVSVAATLLTLASPASAQTVTGWTGFTPANGDGVSVLHNSTIINSPKIRAESRVYTTVGSGVPRAYLGVRARLFKSGVLCQAIDYQYNPTPDVTSWTAGTTADCGAGSYNSHGFISVFDNTNGYQESITFPSNPLNYSGPTAARTTATPNTAVSTGKNAQGKTYGSAANEASIPDLVAVIATNGKTGYITKSALDGSKPKNPTEALAQQTSGRTVPVYETDGVTKVGDFKFS